MAFRDNYKTRLCHLFARGICDRVSCTFAHGEEDLRKVGSGGRSFGFRRHNSPPDYHEKRRHYSPIRKRGRSPSPGRPYDDYSDRSRESRSPSPSYSSEEKYRTRKRDRRGDEERAVEVSAGSAWARLEEEKGIIIKDIAVKSEHAATLQTLLDRKMELADDLSAHANMLEKEITEKEAEINKISMGLKTLVKAQQRVVSSQDDVKRLQAKLQKLVAEMSPDDASPFSAELPQRETSPASRDNSKIEGHPSRAPDRDLKVLPHTRVVTASDVISKGLRTNFSGSELSQEVAAEDIAEGEARNGSELLPKGPPAAAMSARSSRSSGSRNVSASIAAEGPPDVLGPEPVTINSSQQYSFGGRRQVSGEKLKGEIVHRDPRLNTETKEEGHSAELREKQRSSGRRRVHYEGSPEPKSDRNQVEPELSSKVAQTVWTRSFDSPPAVSGVGHWQSAQMEMKIDEERDGKDDLPRVSMKFSREGGSGKRNTRDTDQVESGSGAPDSEKGGPLLSGRSQGLEDVRLEPEIAKKGARAMADFKPDAEKRPLFPIKEVNRSLAARGGPSLLQKHQLQVQEQLKQAQEVRQQVEFEKEERMRALMSAGNDDDIHADSADKAPDALSSLQDSEAEGGSKADAQAHQETIQEASKGTSKDSKIKIGYGKLVQPHQVQKASRQAEAKESKLAKVAKDAGKPAAQPAGEDPSKKQATQFEYKYHFKPEDRAEAPAMSQQYLPAVNPYPTPESEYMAGFSVDSGASQQAYMGGYGVEQFIPDPMFMQQDTASGSANLYFGDAPPAGIPDASELQLEDSEPNPPGMDNDDDGPPGEGKYDHHASASVDRFGVAEVACGAALHYTSEFYLSCCVEASADQPEFPHPLSNSRLPSNG